MSTSGNEYDEPGVNYPDRRDTDEVADTATSTGEAAPRDADDGSRATAPGEAGDHHGHDGGRDTMTVDEAQRSGALGERGEQKMPAMSENNATAYDKLDGLVAQMRADLAGESVATVEHALRGRIEQAGLEVSDAEFGDLVHRIAADTDD